jgi:acetyl-CoA carboxylase biotin carboxyl carrier protein
MKGAEIMNLKELKELIEAMNRSAITHFEMEQEGLKLSLRKDTALQINGAQATAMTMSALSPAAAAANAPIAVAAVPIAAPPTAPANLPAATAMLAAAPAAVTPAVVTPAPAVEEGITVIKSPMVGVFYEAPQPGAPPFVKIGDQISEGQVLCIIEAMKLMNEVQAEIEGTIVDILIKNEEMAEFGQPLFKVKIK